MMEFPEAVVIARQFQTELEGRRIVSANAGNAAHKFAFYQPSREEIGGLLADKAVGAARADGRTVVVDLEPGHIFRFGDGGLRVLLHAKGAKPPKKHHLFVELASGAFLTISIQGWGFMQVTTAGHGDAHPYYGEAHGPSPLADRLGYEAFCGILDEYVAKEGKSIKAMLVDGKYVAGIGNGCLQDILFHTRIHPRRQVEGLSERERRLLHESVLRVIRDAAAAGGRDTERDLYDQPGGYRATMDKNTAGTACPACGTRIEKIQYLGGSCYFCPACQPTP